MRRVALFHIAFFAIIIIIASPFWARGDNTNEEYLIGDWKTSDGTALSFYNDGVFSFGWGILGDEEGEWYAESTSSDSFVIDVDDLWSG